MITIIQAILGLEVPDEKKLELIRVLLKETSPVPTSVPCTPGMQPLPPQFQDPTVSSGSFSGIRSANR